MDSSVVFARWRQCAPLSNTCFFRPHLQVQLVVKPVEQPAALCKQTFNRLSYWLLNWFDNQLNVYTMQPVVLPRLSNCTSSWTIGWSSGWMFVYTTQPVLNLVERPVEQLVTSCK